MRRSKYRRASAGFSGRRRIVAAVATLVAFGGILTVTQISEAGTRRQAMQRALAACDNVQAQSTSRRTWSTEINRSSWTSKRGRVRHHADDGARVPANREQMRQRCRQRVMQNVGRVQAGTNNQVNQNQQGQQQNGQNQQGQNQQGQQQNGQNQQGQNQGNQGNNNAGQAPGAGLGVLANNCDNSGLQPHDGFQNGSRCVSTQFGEVGESENNPSLLITDFPEQVGVNQGFTLRVSTRNLIRDRFLAAGQGGYYVESSLLNGEGLVRGHFHTACRMLQSDDFAPDPAPAPAFFVATEDNRGGRQPDQVTIQVSGLPQAGLAQCAVWAGDGSHRIPMMERANQTPAFDAVRIEVGGGDQGGDNNDGQGQNQQGQQGQNQQGQQGQNQQGQQGQNQQGQNQQGQR